MRRRMWSTLGGWSLMVGSVWAQPQPIGPALPEPPPLPKLTAVPGNAEGPILPVSEQMIPGKTVSTFIPPTELPAPNPVPVFPNAPTDAPNPPNLVQPSEAKPLPTVIEETPTTKTEVEPHRVRGQLPRTWGGDEYMLWWIKDSPGIPAIAVQGLRGSPPIYGGANTRTMMEGPIDHSERSGGRFQSGWTFATESAVGMEIVYFFLGTRTDRFHIGNNGAGTSTLGRPFIDANTGAESALVIAEPGVSRGYIQAALSSRVTGWEVNGVGQLFDTDHFELDGIFGWRYFLLNEGLRVDSYSTPMFGASGDMRPDYLMISDQIDASNRFFGGQIGFRSNYRRNGLFLETVGKIAYGQTNHVVRIHGVNAMLGGDFPMMISPGGFFGQQTNSGRFTESTISWLPEGSIRFGFHFSDHSRFYVGYNFVYLTDVVRPTGQIERTINPSQVPMLTQPPALVGAERPEFRMSRTDFWAQGLLIGIESRW